MVFWLSRGFYFYQQPIFTARHAGEPVAPSSKLDAIRTGSCALHVPDAGDTSSGRQVI
jgi:hypothetical protein